MQNNCVDRVDQVNNFGRGAERKEKKNKNRRKIIEREVE